jgi:hypothetical protein
MTCASNQPLTSDPAEDIYGNSRTVHGHDSRRKESLRIQPSFRLGSLFGSIETWIKAGEIGANLLTGLAGYSFEDLAHRINLYRESLVKHGHPPDAEQVTVMLHTFIGNDDDDTLKDKVRPYLTDYLRSHIKQFTPLMLNVEEVKKDDLNAIVSLAF